MSDTDLTTLLREHVDVWDSLGCYERCSCGHEGFFKDRHEHIASVLSGVYAITPLPVVSIRSGNCDPLVAVREVLQSWDDGDYDAEGDFAPHHVVRHLRQALGDVS